MSKSTIEIKTAFEGCAEVCDEYKPSNINGVYTDLNGKPYLRIGNKWDCKNRELCQHIKRVIDILSEQTAANPLDDLFADSLEKLDGLKVERKDNPTIEIVRCKDCMQNTINTDGTTLPWCYKFGYAVEDTDFCSYGERIESEE